MSIDDASTGLASAAPRIATPYSVSIPQTFGTDIAPDYCRACSRRRREPVAAWDPRDLRLQVLAGRGLFDLATTRRLTTLADQGAYEHDALSLLARDLGPVVGVGRVGEVFVLAELLFDRVEQVLGGDAPGSTADLTLDRQLLRAPHHVCLLYTSDAADDLLCVDL